MCAHHTPSSSKNRKTFHFYFIAIILGLISGYFNIAPLINAGEIITDNFVKIFKFVSLPIISLSIIVTLSSFRENRYVKMIGKKTLSYTVSTTLLAATITCILYFFIAPDNIGVNPIHTDKVGIDNTNYLSYLNNLVPSNIFAPFIEHQVMGVLIVSMLIGIAISFIAKEDERNAVNRFFKGIHSIFMVITSWIVKIIPIALFGFITTTVVQLKTGADISGLSKYLFVIVLANIVQGFVILPLFLYAHKIRPFVAMKGMLPALSVAFFSKSSAGTLPITINTIETNLHVSPKVSRFVLPLCTSINMNGCAAFIFATVIYLMQNNGIEISYFTMIIWIFISTIAAIGNAGVPMGCFFLSASLLTSMNVPIELLGLILPFYSVIDMIETALNVWSDSCVTKMIDEKVSKQGLSI